jgi:hypothetical protein
MDGIKLTAIVSLILALSIASERLVEIIKGWIPVLDQPRTDPKEESRRGSCLQILAVFSGILTAYLARDYVPAEIAGSVQGGAWVGLGLLASGGSGFWNSVLTYVTKVKDIKTVQADQQKTSAIIAKTSVG